MNDGYFVDFRKLFIMPLVNSFLYLISVGIILSGRRVSTVFVVDMMDCIIIASFNFNRIIHFHPNRLHINTLGKGMNPFIHQSYCAGIPSEVHVRLYNLTHIVLQVWMECMTRRWLHDGRKKCKVSCVYSILSGKLKCRVTWGWASCQYLKNIFSFLIFRIQQIKKIS